MIIAAFFFTRPSPAGSELGRSIAAALQRTLESEGLVTSTPEWRPINPTDKGWWLRTKLDGEEHILILTPLEGTPSGDQRWLLSIHRTRFPGFISQLKTLLQGAYSEPYRRLGHLAEISHRALKDEGAREIDWPREGKDNAMDELLARLSATA